MERDRRNTQSVVALSNSEGQTAGGTRETTETGACDYTARSWKGRRNEKGGKFFFSLGVEEGGRTACGREISSWVGYPGGSSSGCLMS